MLAQVRRLSRPVAVLALAIFVAPVPAAECRPMDGSPAVEMDCCGGADTAVQLDPECCTVRQQVPAPDHPAAVAPLRPAGAVAPSSTIPLAIASVVRHSAGSLPAPVLPDERLYLRLSVIRR